MAIITTILGTDVISTSRTTINTNFTNLNTDKIETSYLDTDTSLAANSDTKLATQKAVKTYIDTSGGANASETVRGIVEEATDAEVTAGTATGGTGAKLFVTPAKLATRIPNLSIATTQLTGLVPIASLPVPAFQQLVSLQDAIVAGLYGATSNQDGSVLVLLTSIANELFRLERDSLTGLYLVTHNVLMTGGPHLASITILGSYVYLFDDGGAGNTVNSYRYNLADLTSETAMTVPSLDTSGANFNTTCWNDGTFVYVLQNKASTVVNKWSVSGTTFTAVSTSTAGTGVQASATGNGNMYDGTNVYYGISFSSGTINIRKFTTPDGATTTNTTKLLSGLSTDPTQTGAILINLGSGRMYVGRLENISDAAAIVGNPISLYPITKP